jgi:hypothetical protein
MFKTGRLNNPKVFGNKKYKGHTTGEPKKNSQVHTCMTIAIY